MSSIVRLVLRSQRIVTFLLTLARPSPISQPEQVRLDARAQGLALNFMTSTFIPWTLVT